MIHSFEFKKFSKECNFEHRPSSPKYPRSNDLAERYVQIVKNLMKKSLYDRKDPYLALLELNNTPISYKIQSPNQILLGRNVRGVLGIEPAHNGEIQNYSEVKNLLQNEQKRYHDKNATQLPTKERM